MAKQMYPRCRGNCETCNTPCELVDDGYRKDRRTEFKRR